ncbi:hypothetical protein J2Y48_004546 [Mycoplana sp. BE70]|uniref:hypothetical protein n=1 Tax=Mycoplana sp. BE70 TaxID=2817775 RepID=UPI0028580238|nr:hypothetical protein [Mycoplana sp. BE70]MDR6759230.1 hypothetical protein [Mycoplana sp. BE70]
MADTLEELSLEEVRWLKRIADGRIHVVPTVVAERLESLGLADQVPPKAEEIAVELELESLGTRINDAGLRLLESQE